VKPKVLANVVLLLVAVGLENFNFILSLLIFISKIWCSS